MLKVPLRQRTGLNVRAKFSLQLDMTEVKKCDSNFTQYNYPRIDSSQPRFADLFSCDKSDPIGIGSSASVYECQSKDTKEQLCVKIT